MLKGPCGAEEAAFVLLSTGALFGLDLKVLEALKRAGNCNPEWYASELAVSFTTALPEDLILSALRNRGRLPEDAALPATPAGIREMGGEARNFALRFWFALKADAERAPYTACLRYGVSLSVAEAAAESTALDLLAFIDGCPQAWMPRLPPDFIIEEAEALQALGGRAERVATAMESAHEARAIVRYRKFLHLAQTGIASLRAAVKRSDWARSIERAWSFWKDAHPGAFEEAPAEDPLILPRLSEEERKAYAAKDAREAAQSRAWLDMTEARVAGTLGGMPAAKLEGVERQALYGTVRLMAGYLLTVGLTRYQIMALTGVSSFAVKKLVSTLTSLGYTVSNGQTTRRITMHGSAAVRAMAALQLYLWGCLYIALSGGKSVDRIQIASFLLAMDVWKKVVFPKLGMKNGLEASECFEYAQKLRMTGLRNVGICIHCGSVILPVFGTSTPIEDAEPQMNMHMEACPICVMKRTGRFVDIGSFDPSAMQRHMKDVPAPGEIVREAPESAKPSEAAEPPKKRASTLRKSARKPVKDAA